MRRGYIQLFWGKVALDKNTKAYFAQTIYIYRTSYMYIVSCAYQKAWSGANNGTSIELLYNCVNLYNIMPKAPKHIFYTTVPFS